MAKVILVTGTSTSVGIQIAVQMAKAGHTVYAAMCNLANRDALDTEAKKSGALLNVLPFDVDDSTGVEAAINQVIIAEGQIDKIISKVGVGYMVSNGYESTADVNSRTLRGGR